MSNNDKKRDNALIFNAVLFSLAMFFGLFSMPSFAAEVENVQIGTTTISGTSQTIAITPVTDNKSILIFTLTTQSTASGPQDTHVRGQLSCIAGSCDSIDFKRYGSGDSVIIRWQVIEFTDASLMTVQRGIVTQSSMAGSPPSKTISTGVDTSKSFVMLSEFVHGTVTSNDDFTRGQINSSGNLVITVGEKKTLATQAEVAWQVIEYQDANIQTGDISFSTSDASKTIAISTVDLDKSLLVYNYYSTGTSSDNPVCQNLVSGLIDNATTLQFDRGCAGHNGEIHLSWFAIEFTDASIVQHDKLAFTSTELSKTVTLTKVVDTSCAVVTTGYHQRGGQSPATVDHTSSAWFNANINAAGDEITLTRGQTNGVNAETGWSVVEFEGCGFAVPTPSSTNKCFAMSDDAAELYSFDLDISTAPTSVATSMILNGEGATYRATNNAVYTFHQTTEGTSEPSDLYRVDLDGTITLIKSNFMTEAGVGAEFVHYSDGTERLVVLLREWDSRIQIYDATDLTNSVPLSTLPLLFPDGSNAKVDSLAINPNTGEVLVVDDADDASDYPEIYSVDMDTGQLTLKVTLIVPGIDAESLAFAEDGNAYLENESSKTPDEYDHRIFRVDLTSGGVTPVEENLNSLITGDIEGMSCTGSKIITPKSGSMISGTVFNDVDGNDAFDSVEPLLGDISVWLQLVNADSSIDPFKIFATTNALGVYQISGIADGNYQLTVDDDDTDLPVAHVVGGTNPLIITINGSNITNADFPFDEVVCTAFTGEVSEIGIPLAGQLKTTDKLFVPSRDVLASTGHLRAYAVDAGGNAATSASWDAATLMNSTNRTTGLYSTDSGGKIQKFDSLNEINDATRQYIIDTPLGAISRGNDLDLITQKMDISLYLTDTVYRKYYEDKVTIRDQLVLTTSDDGFLYAFNYNTGALEWAWMPRSLHSKLTGDDSYQDQHLMAGSVDVLDLPDGSGKYDTYVVGAYKNGLGHYVLKLKDDGSLDKLIWDDDQSSTFTESPNNGEMEFFRDGSGDVYAAYVLSNTTAANTSLLKIRSLSVNTTDMSVGLNYQATSTPFVMPDFDKRNAPSKHTLYLGNLTGDIHNAVILTSSGLLKSDTLIKGELEGTSVTAMDDNPSDAVLYLDASVSSTDNRYYLSSQSATRLSIHRYHSSDQSWHKRWTSYVSGAGSWDSSDNYTNDNSGVPTVKDGFNVVPPTTGIQSLPADARITAKATIVGDRVVLPLSVLDSAASACYGKAYYYLYRLSDGNFPTQSFIKKDGTYIVENIPLGYGEASQLSITDLAGTNKLLGYGVADKDVDLNSGIATSFIIKDPVTTGVRGWKEIGR